MAAENEIYHNFLDPFIITTPLRFGATPKPTMNTVAATASIATAVAGCVNNALKTDANSNKEEDVSAMTACPAFLARCL